jgi:DNA-3-methyladenine glycosylase II
VHGIGPWTADIYLLFCLGHADAFPAGDLAVQEAAKLAFGLKTRPNAKELTALAESWRPFRGAAAYLLWAYYKVAKGRSGTPAENAAKKAAKKTAKKTARKKSAKKSAAKKRAAKKRKGKK